jgi:cytoskeletal protein CcmA (bactofilin family)
MQCGIIPEHKFQEKKMKRNMVGFIAGITLLMILAGCDGLVTSNLNTGTNNGSGHYYVDKVPARNIPVVDELNNGDQNKTDFVIAEAFNKYDAIYLVGKGKSGNGVTVVVPPGKTLYVAPGSNVVGFDVAAGVSKGAPARAGVNPNSGPGTLVVLDGATMNLTGPSTLGGLLQVNVGGTISGSAVITGAGRVVVGGKVSAKSITVAGDVHVAQGDGSRYGLVRADIDTTYLSLPTNVPDAEGKIKQNPGRSNEDFYAFENVKPEASRDVRVDGVVMGSISSGGNVCVAENNRVTGLNTVHGYVTGSGAGPTVIVAYGNVEVLGNVEGSVIANGSVTVGSKLSTPHQAQVKSAIYSRTGNVTIKKAASSGAIVAYQGAVTIEVGAAAAGIDTYYDNFNNGDSTVARGDVIVRGMVGGALGAGNIASGGSVLVEAYKPGFFGHDGSVSGNVFARRSVAIEGVVLGSLDTAGNTFDGTPAQNQNVTINGVVGGAVKAGGVLALADHHSDPAAAALYVTLNNTKIVYVHGYVGGGLEVLSQHGTGKSIIKGFVEGGPVHIGSQAELVIAGTGRVNALGSTGVKVEGKLHIDAAGELDVDAANKILYGVANSPLADSHIAAHAKGLADSGRVGPPGSGITIAEGARLYTKTPVATSTEQLFRDLATSTAIHTNAAPPSLATPLAAFTVAPDNGVTLIQNTSLSGDLAVNGWLNLNGHILASTGAIALASANSDVFKYESGSHRNGHILFGYTAPSYGVIKFDSATAVLSGLSSPENRTGFDASGNKFNSSPEVIGVITPSVGSNIAAVTVAEFAPHPAVVPSANFAPGNGVVLAGAASGGPDYLNKDSKYIWGYTVYTP